MNGLIVSYNDERGFGFIQPLIGKPNEAQRIFFHVTAVRASKGVRATVPKGAEVRFRLVRGEKGPQAADVELVELSGRAVQTGSPT